MITAKMIDALLPQTQCGECGYPGCLPYAEALACGAAPIDRCPPGGVATVEALADLLEIDATPYILTAKANTRTPSIAVIREMECIGCTKCIQACPVDAIIGSGKLMHAVLTDECTGCGLCIEPCPVDCIDLVPTSQFNYNKDTARRRFNAKKQRLLEEEHSKEQLYRKKSNLKVESNNTIPDIQAKQIYIQQAIERVQSKKATKSK